MQRSLSHARYSRILVIKLADIGDMLTITPAMQALRAAYPRARIDLLTPPSSAGILKGAPFVDDIIAFDKFPFDTPSGLLNLPNVVRSARFLLGVRRKGYDVVALFHHFATRLGVLKFAVLVLGSGAPVRAGIDNGYGFFLTHRVPNEGFGAMHEAAYWLQVAGLLGADTGSGWRPCVPLSHHDGEVAGTLLAEMGMNRANRRGPLVAMHAGAGWYSKARMWPVERFAQVARALVRECDASVLVLGGTDEVELAGRLETLAGEPGRVLSVAGRTSIHETAALLVQCDLFVGNDSGPMHLAAAVGTPVVAIFGPSNQQAWGPYTPPGEPGPHRIVARQDLPCMPCFYRKHSIGLREGCGPRPCLAGLGYEPVLQACLEALARIDDRSPVSLG